MIKLPLLPTRLSSHVSICLIGGLSLLTSNAAHAAIMSFQEGISPSGAYTTGGVTIRADGQSATNQDSSNQIIVGRYSDSNDNSKLRGLLQFDLTAIETAAGGAAFTINSVSLVMHTASEAGAGADSAIFNLNLLGTNSHFDETAATWDNAPDSGAGGTIGTFLSSADFIPATTNTDRTFASTAAFTTAVNSALTTDANNTISFILSINDEADSIRSFARFDSDEVSTLANRPELIIDYTIVPEPSAFALLLGGVSALVCFRRRQRNDIR